MSKNTELLSGILTCMIKLTDKLHATNNKMIDLNDKFDNLSFKNVDELSGKVSEINTKIDSISSQISNINLSGDLEKFIDEDELEIRLDQLDAKDIDVNEDLMSQIKDLENLQNNKNLN